MLKKPLNPHFSCGPCTKRPNYHLSHLNTSLLGRYHRSKDVKLYLQKLVDTLRYTINIPNDYKIVITPGSATGATEVALWNLLGKNNVDCIAWDYFGALWAYDIEVQLKVQTLRKFLSDSGYFPDIEQVDFYNNDVIFPYCGTTNGMIFTHEDKIPNKRNGLIIVDATSYVFGYSIDWQKFDAVTFSWQKALGGEAQTGILVLSPAAVKRLKTHTPSWAIPKILKLKTTDNQLMEEVLNTGEPLNSISLLLCADFLDTLSYFQSIGGVTYAKKKCQENSQIIRQWVDNSKWVSFVAQDKKYISNMVACLKIVDNDYLALKPNEQNDFLNNMLHSLEQQHVAFDIKSHRNSPLGIRIWSGPYIDTQDLQYLVKWLDHAFYQEKTLPNKKVNYY